MSPWANQRLTSAQIAALQAVRARGEVPEGSQEVLARAIAAMARVHIHFHPYRRLPSGASVVEGLLRDGLYRGQFETGISNGGATAFPGGDRFRWEERLFDGAYQMASDAERPKYGALSLLPHSDGAAPRFGSCTLVLRQDVTARCTFSWGDSYLEPSEVGTVERLGSVLGGLFGELRSDGKALGMEGVEEEAMRGMLHAHLSESAFPESNEERLSSQLLQADPGRSLDSYVEAQVHGAIDLSRDVEALVVDGSLCDATQRELRGQVTDLAHQHGFALRWQRGFRMSPLDIPSEFRGERIPVFARRLHSTKIDAGVLADAATSIHQTPERWSDWASPEETLQHLKQLWHCLVAFGQPALVDS
ncbi:MAG: hypothetical protein ACI8QS_001797 [Planctomycetota bacterium]|jgi:hypothetical protein